MISVAAKRLHQAFPQATVLFTLRNQYTVRQPLNLDSGRYQIGNGNRLISPIMSIKTMKFFEFIAAQSKIVAPELEAADQQNRFQYARTLDIYSHYFGKKQISIPLYEDLLADPKIQQRHLGALWLSVSQLGNCNEARENRRSSMRETLYWRQRSRLPVKSIREILRLSPGQVQSITEFFEKETPSLSTPVKLGRQFGIFLQMGIAG